MKDMNHSDEGPIKMTGQLDLQKGSSCGVFVVRKWLVLTKTSEPATWSWVPKAWVGCEEQRLAHQVQYKKC